VITKEDLDRFTRSFAPEVGESARGRVAVQYAKTLAYSHLAEEMGLDKNPALAKELDYQLKVIRMRILASAFLQVQQQKARIADSDIQKYYDDHHDEYEQVRVRRLAVPAAVPTEDSRPLDRAKVIAELTELQKRAAAGEDMDLLQKEAFKDLHIQATPPPVVVKPLLRGALQGNDAKVFDMKPGEVSGVIDSAAAWAIIKLESRDVTPFNEARRDIEAALRLQLVQKEVGESAKKIHAQFNLPYLGLSAQPNLLSVTGAVPVTGESALKSDGPQR